ncbi:DNA damage response protein (pescadillo homologue), putative [Theileria annulata]|uniref:Pescadillo homolog n=1 Tax=Theileria annulata TaxID=5874 RepID=Q4UA76_THEAN|nr:DNA damage response protein (pescadillo homologue), putative [Theileria annulata]CAI76277.1 DNA damage response protein (pescadillo homologue), putative [Theileria annulata]|eukprot:XP_952901.1 DNA damage response protein (pescadillo homologue), putative [Theileria annulata]
MTLKKKPGKEGSTKNFITRTQAVRRLQVSLRDFQRLCILKGVYPRDVARGGTLTSKGINRRRLKKDKIYYHINDIRNLASGELLPKFRDISSHLKKFKRLVERGEKFDAKLKAKNRPRYSLAPIVKERCPSLVSALEDLDDAISTIAAVSGIPPNLFIRKRILILFIGLSGDESRGLNPTLVSKCSTQLNHFLKYVADTGCLKKTFISIKGFYFQAVILNVTVTWIQPHSFSQKLPYEVDFNVISTFVEYYLELVKLVNYKLYLMANIEYPPKTRPGLEDLGDEFYNFELKRVASEPGLFANLRFFISKEVPLTPTSLVILSAGGVIVDSPKEATHAIVDKPLTELEFTCNYVQPQYVFDCLNCNVVLPTSQYSLGAKLPHHLSPFEDGVYVPDRKVELEKIIREATGKKPEERGDKDQSNYIEDLTEELVSVVFGQNFYRILSSGSLEDL